MHSGPVTACVLRGQISQLFGKKYNCFIFLFSSRAYFRLFWWLSSNNLSPASLIFCYVQDYQWSAYSIRVCPFGLDPWYEAHHPGVPNSHLLQENTITAQTYDEKRIVEQNSINLAWQILREQQYTELWAAICATPYEETRFRHLIVNSVCAMDIIIDKD